MRADWVNTNEEGRRKGAWRGPRNNDTSMFTGEFIIMRIRQGRGDMVRQGRRKLDKHRKVQSH